MLGQDVAEADWLIGVGLFLPGVNARALRDMAAPGTAYDDPALGRDPQVAHLDDFVHTTDDNGGVHLNSGIPNRAFHLAATGIGGTSWEGAGAIWYAALTGARCRPRHRLRGLRGGHGVRRRRARWVVTAAWVAVGVTPTSGASASAGPPAEATPEPPTPQVEVRRTGGFAGLTVSGKVDLRMASARAERVRELVDRVDVTAVTGGEPHPDRYSYTFCLPGCPDVDVAEQHLTDDLRELADLVLEPGEPDR